MKILDRINSPKDLKHLTREELTRLADELRYEIITTVSRTGGHLAPSLGVVELTIALHYVFQAPQDKIIWDVGHQCYAHKLLTGRKEQFSTLRQYGGLSGFPSPQESPYDAAYTGHASTSVSLGLGFSTAHYLKGKKDRVIAVIGDGSMTGGMSFEALNQAGHLDRDLIVILNDNEMSISPNVGALSSFLSRKMRGKRFMTLKKDMENFFKSLPAGIGESLLTWFKKSEDSFTGFFTPGMIFAALKFDYIGPIRGHRLEELIGTFENLGHLKGPVLIHVLTKKGKGYEPAERNPTYFHGVGKFEVKTGGPHLVSPRLIPTYTEVFGQTLTEMARENEKILAITAAMPEGTGLAGFAGEFPERFFDIGIAEQHAVTFAAALALEGFRPVVAIYSTFLQRAYDQILHDVCLPKAPVLFAMDRGGIVGEDGATHQGIFDLSYLRNIPGMTIMAPKDENELRGMLNTALEYDGPSALRYPRGEGVGVSLDGPAPIVPYGKGELLLEGDDLLILAVGSTVYPALEAASSLRTEGISVALINARFIKPLDEDLIGKWARRCPVVITVEENALPGGFGSAVLEFLAGAGIHPQKVKCLGIPDQFVEHGPQKTLREKFGLDPAGIARSARELAGLHDIIKKATG